MVWRGQKPYGLPMVSRDSAFCALLLVAMSFGAPAWAAGPVKSAKPARPAQTVRSAPPAAPAEPAPVDQAALMAQARAASAKGDTELALRMAQAAIVADPSRPASYDVLADVYSANHQPDAARYYYDQALAIDPTDDGAIKAIAALDRAGDTRKADASDGAKPGVP